MFLFLRFRILCFTTQKRIVYGFVASLVQNLNSPLESSLGQTSGLCASSCIRRFTVICVNGHNFFNPVTVSKLNIYPESVKVVFGQKMFHQIDWTLRLCVNSKIWICFVVFI
jgi:hypothetical protein